MGKYDEKSVIKTLKNTKGIELIINEKIIKINSSANLGNSTYGKIDFLCNYCKWKKELYSSPVEECDDETTCIKDNKLYKRESKVINKHYT